MKKSTKIKKFDAVVPCYNEESRVGNVLDTLTKSKYINQVIFINDGSKDNSLRVAKEYSNIKIINLKENTGKGNAVSKGLKHVKSKAVFLFDADLVGLKEINIKKIYMSFIDNPNSMVVGLRQKNSINLIHWLRRNILPLIAGERILSTTELKKIIHEYDIDEWGLEVYMNYHFKTNNIPIHKILLNGVNDVPKFKKEEYGIQPFIEEALKLSSKYYQIYSKEIPKNIYNSLPTFSLPMILTNNEKKNSIYTKSIYSIHQITVRNKKINFAKAGKGPSLVFVHGLANNWISWIPLTNYLYKNYTTYLIDLPGFGDSDDLDKYSINIAANYLEGFIEKLPEKPISVIGQSMGSMVVSETFKKSNKLSNSIVLIAPVIKNKNLKRLASHTLESSLKIIDKFSISEMFLKKIIDTRIAAYTASKYINMHKFDKFLVDEYGMIGKKKMRKETFVQMGHSSALYDQKSTLMNLNISTLIIYGKEDKISSPDDVNNTILSNNKSINLKVVPFAGHVVSLEQPEEVAKNIKDFLN